MIDATMALILLFLAQAAMANDWNMGDFISNPEMKVFVGSVRKAHRRIGNEQIDTAVLRVSQVLGGKLNSKVVGVILRPSEPLPAVGSELLVLTSRNTSPYVPASLWSLTPENRTNVISCAQLSERFVAAASLEERISVMHQLVKLPAPCSGGGIAVSLVANYCSKQLGKHLSNEAFRAGMEKCRLDHEPGMSEQRK
jgi:hypothetical protein